jgi:hypothetical protein
MANFSKNDRQVIQKQIEDIDKILDVLINDDIEADIDHCKDGDQDREIHLFNIGRAHCYDGEDFQEHLNDTAEIIERINEFIANLSNIKSSLEEL